MNRFNSYWDWTYFSLGIGIAKPSVKMGWNLYIGIDIGFLSLWVCFIKDDSWIKLKKWKSSRMI
jgi:hypothetical protein